MCSFLVWLCVWLLLKLVICNIVKNYFWQDEEVNNGGSSRKKFQFRSKSGGEVKSILKKREERLNDSGLGDSFVVS